MTRVYFRIPDARYFFQSFLGLMDIKIGATIITLFALFNKIAGFYGIIAVFQGGTIAQVSLYIYSIGTIVIFLYGLKGISEENSRTTLLYAHMFTLDHMLSTFWTLLFAFWWYLYTPHDGEKVINSNHQGDLMALIESIEATYRTGPVPEHHQLVGEARKKSAEDIWKAERGFAAGALIFGWLVKVYFALCIYAYALHLRHGTYRTLPLSKPSGAGTATGGNAIPLRGSTRGNYRYHPVLNHSIAEVDEEELPGWSDDEDEREPNETARSQEEGTSSGAGSRPANPLRSQSQPEEQGSSKPPALRAVVDRLAA